MRRPVSTPDDEKVLLEAVVAGWGRNGKVDQ